MDGKASQALERGDRQRGIVGRKEWRMAIRRRGSRRCRSLSTVRRVFTLLSRPMKTSDSVDFGHWRCGDSCCRGPSNRRSQRSWSTIAICRNSQGGNWLRGEKEFFGTTANCSKCHTMRGVGGKIGPDLSNLPQRDYASVLRDVTQPSFAINPDYVSQTVLLADGRTLAGTTAHRRRESDRRRSGRKGNRRPARGGRRARPLAAVDHAGGFAEGARRGAAARLDDVSARRAAAHAGLRRAPPSPAAAAGRRGSGAWLALEKVAVAATAARWCSSAEPRTMAPASMTIPPGK